MSNSSANLNDPEPGLPNVVVSALSIVGALLIGVVVVALAYSATRTTTVVEDGLSDAERWELLRSRMDQESRELSEFGWVNRNENIVRLPIEVAMEKTLVAINRGEDPLPSRAVAVEEAAPEAAAPEEETETAAEEETPVSEEEAPAAEEMPAEEESVEETTGEPAPEETSGEEDSSAEAEEEGDED